ncbi:MAG TPA: hypothetical protein VNN18_04650 [Candidatus Xenobia bacterium]|nr:hypothetical protein [Candidatus Xenobia bacterium]
MNRRLLGALAGLGVVLVTSVAAAQESRSILVTLAKPLESVAASEFEVRVGNQPAQVTRVYQPEERPLRLALLIDDSAGPTLTQNLSELRQFIDGLPAGARVMVAYKRGGALQIEQPFTTDRAAAVGALHLPAQAGGGGDLAGSIVELLEYFPPGLPERGQILYLGEGDSLSGQTYHDPSLNRALPRIQERGVVVWVLHVGSSTGEIGHVDQQAYLQRLASETGGQALALGLHPPSLLPYLKELREYFDRQYGVEFQPPPGSAGKKLQVKLSGGRPRLFHAAQ